MPQTTVSEVVVIGDRSYRDAFDFENDYDYWPSYYDQTIDFAFTGGIVGLTPGQPAPTGEPGTREAVVAGIRARLAETGELSQADRELMIAEGIDLRELLKPGWYQGEFTVGAIGEHRQWIHVPHDGSEAQLITGRVDPIDGSRLTVSIVPWMSDRHGLLSGDGDHRIYAAASTLNNAALSQEMFAQAVSIVAQLNSAGLNYNVLFQNSNSAFSTIGELIGLNDFDAGFTPGDNVNLFDRIANGQAPALAVSQLGSYSGSFASDTVQGGPNATIFDGAAGNDFITGGAFGDILNGGEGDDTLTLMYGGAASGGDGQDTLQVIGSDASFLFGNFGDDTITGGDGNDWVNGGDGDDYLYGGSGNDELVGGFGEDWIEGGDGDDIIRGGLGSDRQLSGGNGNDTIYSGDISDDIMVGGFGADTFVVHTYASNTQESGFVTVADFEIGIDILDLRSLRVTPNDIIAFSWFGINTVVAVDIYGDGQFDFMISLNQTVASTIANDILF